MKKTLLNLTTIIIYCLIFFIFTAPSAMTFFVMPGIEALKAFPGFIMNFCGYVVLFMICLGTEKTDIKKMLAAFAVTLPFKFAADQFVNYLTDAVILRDWAYDLIFLMLTGVTAISVMAVYRINPFKKRKIIYFILTAVSAAVIISWGFIIAEVSTANDYKYQFLSDSSRLKNLGYYTLNIIETYRIGMIAVRAVLLFGVSGLCRDGKEDGIKLRITASAFLLVYLIINIFYNTANVVSGIHFTNNTFVKTNGELSEDYINFGIYRGQPDFRYLCFAQVKNYVYLGDELMCTYYTDPLAPCGWSVDYADYDYESIVCQLDKVLYLKNGKWKTIHFSEFANAREDEHLTEICHTLCDTGSAEALKYLAPYLKKYDPDYLYDLVENFDERQTDVSGNELLREQYISDVINNILNDR